LCEKFRQLYDICSQQQITDAEAAAMDPEIQSKWRQMIDGIAMIALNEDIDKPKWKYIKNGFFQSNLYTTSSLMWVLTEALKSFGSLRFL
jgi:hypothetical protein